MLSLKHADQWDAATRQQRYSALTAAEAPAMEEDHWHAALIQSLVRHSFTTGHGTLDKCYAPLDSDHLATV